MRASLAVHLLLAASSAVAALLAWRAAAAAERGEAGPFARTTSWLAILLLGQLLAGLWVLGFVPLALGRRLLGEEPAGTAALLGLLLVIATAMRLAWTAQRRPRPRRTAVLLIALVGLAGLLMAAVVAVLRRPVG